MKKIILASALVIFGGVSAQAACNVVDGGNKSAFDGSSLSGLQVEKKALVSLDKAHPGLKAMEKAFKGEVQTCTSCSGKFVTCD